MKAKDILEKYVKKSMWDKVEVIGIAKDLAGRRYWWPIHRNERIINDKEIDTAIRIRKEKEKNVKK